MQLRLAILLFCAVFQCGGVIMRGSGATPVGFCGGFTTSNLHCNSFERVANTSACTTPNEDVGSGGTARSVPSSNPANVRCDCASGAVECINQAPLQGNAPNLIPAGNEVLNVADDVDVEQNIFIENAWANGIDETLYIRFCLQVAAPPLNPPHSTNRVFAPLSDGVSWGDAGFSIGNPSSSGFRIVLWCHDSSNSQNSGDYALNVWHTVTVAWNEASGAGDIWINQDSGGAPDRSCSSAAAGGPWNGYQWYIRANSSQTDPLDYYVDMIDVASDQSLLDDEMFTACPGS